MASIFADWTGASIASISSANAGCVDTENSYLCRARSRSAWAPFARSSNTLRVRRSSATSYFNSPTHEATAAQSTYSSSMWSTAGACIVSLGTWGICPKKNLASVMTNGRTLVKASDVPTAFSIVQCLTMAAICYEHQAMEASEGSSGTMHGRVGSLTTSRTAWSSSAVPDIASGRLISAR
ncbi:hypothetical protein R1flu_024554 [Riccia fluitans]|uniref:Uncharacterized protein n=1 Tax=Riccia fluitans TaxID=41844 RepID=A0ABD1XV78_9MARC